MGREVRMVPADWQHPCYPAEYYLSNRAGQPVPLMAGDYASSAAAWDEGFRRWQEGFVESCSTPERWTPKTEEHTGRYTEWCGPRPSPDDYMPIFADGTATHLMMYEDTSEGTPISPAFATPEELARWLADTGASAFGSSTASYEEWLAMAQHGWAPSAVVEGGILKSGVAAMASPALSKAEGRSLSSASGQEGGDHG